MKDSQLPILSKLHKRVSDIRGKPKINPRLKIRRYKVRPSQAVTTISVSLILSIGLVTSMVLAAIQIDSTLHVTNYQYDYGNPSVSPYDGLAYLMIELKLGIIINYSTNIIYFVLGWFLGGF